MTSPRTRLLALVLLVGAFFIWKDAATTFGQDDPLNYDKTSGVILGEPLPEDPAERAFIDAIPPAHYEPHPGINLPYVDFPAEYPPLAMLFFILPRFFSSDFLGYIQAFATQMTLLVALMGWLLWRISRRISTRPLDGWQVTALTSAFFIGGGWIICRRFDVASAVFVALAVAAELSGGALFAGLLLGLGAATKLWPGFLLPLFLLSSLADGDRRRLVSRLGGFAVGFLGPHLPFIILGGSKAFVYLTYHGARGIQVESLWGNLGMIISKLTGLESHFDMRFGAAHLVSNSGWLAPFVWLSYAAMLLLFAAVFKAAWDGYRRTAVGSIERSQVLVASCAALILGTILTAKVFSTQYVLWTFPVVFALPSALRGNLLRAGTLVMVGLSGVFIQFFYFQHLMKVDWIGILWVFARNMLVLCLAWQAFQSLRAVKDIRPASPT